MAEKMSLSQHHGQLVVVEALGQHIILQKAFVRHKFLSYVNIGFCHVVSKRVEFAFDVRVASVPRS